MPEPEALDEVSDSVIDDFEACATRENHVIDVDCELWPCMVGIVYESPEALRQMECRDQLPPELPTETGMSVRDGARYHWRVQYLADVALIDRWEDQAWRELAQARLELMTGRLVDAADAAETAE